MSTEKNRSAMALLCTSIPNSCSHAPYHFVDLRLSTQEIYFRCVEMFITQVNNVSRRNTRFTCMVCMNMQCTFAHTFPKLI